jgi:hypothetical protein
MLLLPFDVDQRRRETAPGTSLGAIADGLTAELAPWLQSPLPIPAAKARLTRGGGRCPVHGTLLEFDPLLPWAHRCDRCGTSYGDDTHHQWWAMGAQLFTAERTVHAAALYLLRGHDAHRALAVRTLRELAARYATWPNRDNVLGPTRPFFSTYLESIWLLNICHALALLEAAGERTVGDVVRDALLAPSSALIATYHEGRSNRQVWNEVAILSAWTLLGEDARVARRLSQPGSLLSLIEEGVLADGTWYEGENYHQFAHRGLWYGVQLLAALGRPLNAALTARFHEGFAAPFAGLLPDETLPSRRDSQYAVSIRQWRWAEWCELGYACSADRRLAGVLQRLYDGSAPRGRTGRAVSTADAERNTAAVALTRDDCSWRALLMAMPEPVPLGRWTSGSVLQPRQGLAVLRRDEGRVYVALDGGAHAGGHGHPDRLHLTLQQDGHRVLDDPGTGSYVARTLHWYRSTLAHHAPLVNGASQQAGPVTLTAFEDRGGAGWVQKRAVDIAPGVNATRTVVVCDGYLVDLLEWESPHDVTVTLPVAIGEVCDATDAPRWRAASRTGAGGLEDGYEFLTNVHELVDAPPVVQLASLVSSTAAEAGSSSMSAWYTTSAAPTWWRADAPGAPARAAQQRLAVDVHGAGGRTVGVWSWGAVTGVQLDAAGPVFATVTTADGTTATHEPAPHGWHIGLVARHSRSSIDLEYLPADQREEAPRDTVPSTTAPVEELLVPTLATADDVVHRGAVRTLGTDHYVQTEQPWGGDNTPEASVYIGATAEQLVVHVTVRTGHPPVVPPDGHATRMPDNPLDNERADVNADGVQCYVGIAGAPVGRWHAAALVVPLGNGEARVTPLVAGGGAPGVEAEVRADGWELRLCWPRHALPPDSAGALTFDLIVNERPVHRERRRGQLVLSGGGGFGYLRGDRHAPVTQLALRFN